MEKNKEIIIANYGHLERRNVFSRRIVSGGLSFLLGAVLSIPITKLFYGLPEEKPLQTQYYSPVSDRFGENSIINKLERKIFNIENTMLYPVYVQNALCYGLISGATGFLLKKRKS